MPTKGKVVRRDEKAHCVVVRGGHDGVDDVVLRCGVRRNHASERERWRQHTERPGKWCTHREPEPCWPGSSGTEPVSSKAQRGKGASSSAPFPFYVLIHPSAWNRNSANFG